MNETKHTPGPWRIYGRKIMGPRFGNTVAEIHNYQTPQGKDNARLIAAAPELLEVCELVEAGLSNDKPNDPGRQRASMLRDLRAAIARVTGE